MASHDINQAESEGFPKDWKVAKIKDLAGKIKAGGTPKRGIPEYWGGNIPFLLIEDITASGLYINKTKETITKEGLKNSSAWIVPINSLLLTMYATIGATAINKIPLTTNQAIISIIPKPNFNVLYGAYCLRYHANRLIAQNVQCTQKNVNKGIIENFEIPLPSYPEQQQIAHVLSAVQEARDRTQTVIQAARELKKSLMKHLFTYGPVPAVEAKNVHIRETEYGQAPNSWKEKPLEKCAYVQTGVAKGRRLEESQSIKAPYLRVANVQDGYLNLSKIKQIIIKKSEMDRFLLKDGDVLLTEGGDNDKLGRGFIWHNQILNCVHQNHIFAVRSNKSVLLPEFLAYLIQSQYGKAYFLQVAHRTTHLACINSSKLKAFPVLLPMICEQKKIVDILSAIDRKIETEEHKKGAIDSLFKALLHNLMTGKKRVNHLEMPQ